MFEVTTEPVAVVDLGDLTGHRLGILPFLWSTTGGPATVELYGSFGGRSTIVDVRSLDEALSARAQLHRWTNGAWVFVSTIDLQPSTPHSRMAELPTLAPGAYRLVRSSASTVATGEFWVLQERG